MCEGLQDRSVHYSVQFDPKEIKPALSYSFQFKECVNNSNGEKIIQMSSHSQTSSSHTHLQDKHCRMAEAHASLKIYPGKKSDINHSHDHNLMMRLSFLCRCINKIFPTSQQPLLSSCLPFVWYLHLWPGRGKLTIVRGPGRQYQDVRDQILIWSHWSTKTKCVSHPQSSDTFSDALLTDASPLRFILRFPNSSSFFSQPLKCDCGFDFTT